MSRDPGAKHEGHVTLSQAFFSPVTEGWDGIKIQHPSSPSFMILDQNSVSPSKIRKKMIGLAPSQRLA